MDSKCKYWMLLLTLLCVISLGFSLFRVFPCEVGNETFLGIVLSAVGIIVTLVMGYQIFSVVEFRGELQKQKEENIKLAHDNAKLQQMIRNQMGALDKQKGRIEEGLNMCFSYINYFSGQDVCTAFGAFVPMLDALYYSLDSDDDGIDDIFSNLRLFVGKIQTQSFAIPGGCGDVHGKYIITEPQHPFYNRTIDEYMNSRLNPVKNIDDKIRNHKNYKFIKVSYEDIMALFNEKVSKIILDPQNLSFSR